jgi:hypothetical protein
LHAQSSDYLLDTLISEFALFKRGVCVLVLTLIPSEISIRAVGLPTTISYAAQGVAFYTPPSGACSIAVTVATGLSGSAA